ncbi:hypothetical protein ILUMI_26589 [Ignelater luminosus]|uniref:Uncharacterized protein n=1 Tax=Ignelater luminosus TaxID=2038154 RepID=A0A8K0C3N1_IGNLU|nr:hypothetical protein ILUMI_26589 [Ignelater luminosus]
MSTSVVSRRESSLYRHSYPDFRCSAMRECGERIRRERTAPLSPRLALRRVLVLAEGRQFREAAAVLARLGPTALSAIQKTTRSFLNERFCFESMLSRGFPGLTKRAITKLLEKKTPIDLHLTFKEALSQGLTKHYQRITGRLVASNQRPNLNAEPVVWQLVRLLASHDDPGLKTKVGKLAQVLIEYQPDLRRLLTTRRKAFEQAIQGLGCHGLTTDASGLTHLHAALKTELHHHIEAYKTALHKLDELGLATNDTKKPAIRIRQIIFARVSLPIRRDTALKISSFSAFNYFRVLLREETQKKKPN